MYDQNVYQLIARKLSGEATIEELTAFEQMLREDPLLHHQYEMIAEHWKQHQIIPTSKDEARFMEVWSELSAHHIDDNPVLSSRWRRYKIPLAAAIFSCVIATSLLLFNYNKKRNAVSRSEIATTIGSKTKAILPDGTLVWLNAGSKIVYDNNTFNVGNRTVELTGEAFFDVVSNANLPFVVHTAKVSVKVLGTAFNVRAYPDDEHFETSLIRGSVEIHQVGSGQVVRLKPNQKIIVGEAAAVKEINLSTAVKPLTYINEPGIESDSLIAETAWIENKLAFTSLPFSLLAADLERWYNVKFNFGEDQLKQIKFTGVFSGQSLPEVLAALQLTGDFHYRIEKNEVYIFK